MILTSISVLDCIVFILLLIPPLLYNVGLLPTIGWALLNAPYLAIQIPYQFIVERFLTPKDKRSPFVQRSTLFEDVVIRYVRYAFANLPASFGQVFLGKTVSLPFVRYRMLRHGLLRRPVKWTEVNGGSDFQALYIPPPDPAQPITSVVFYCHGGGFAMASSYFYLEFLLAWHAAMRNKPGLTNPAMLAVEYSLVPDHVFPKQLHEVAAAYQYAKQLVQGDAAKICVAGDSAGGTLILSLLLHLAATTKLPASNDTTTHDDAPGFAILISPWPTVLHAEHPPSSTTTTTSPSPLHKDTASDYLNANTLLRYGTAYLGPLTPHDSAYTTASPASCTNPNTWRRALPRHGTLLIYGSEEVLAPDIAALAHRLRAVAGAARVRERCLRGLVHAWPVAALYLADEPAERLGGVREIVDEMQVALAGRSTEDAKSLEGEIESRSVLASG